MGSLVSGDEGPQAPVHATPPLLPWPASVKRRITCLMIPRVSMSQQRQEVMVQEVVSEAMVQEAVAVTVMGLQVVVEEAVAVGGVGVQGVEVQEVGVEAVVVWAVAVGGGVQAVAVRGVGVKMTLEVMVPDGGGGQRVRKSLHIRSPLRRRGFWEGREGCAGIVGGAGRVRLICVRAPWRFLRYCQ